ncbi:hypothetical protein IAQ61_000281 [Plenodomus lingam]|nr:hypothetical protein IAQ61_000281 [Plenodomus lingam]
MRNNALQARQTMATSTSSSVVQPTITLALSTTFTPAASCSSNKLTLLPPPGFFIWANEPVPHGNTTVTNCYPPEFLESYTSTTSKEFGSSIVPVMSPLVCPANFCTVRGTNDNYIACCPSGYSFADPATPSIRDRPYYGGTCYSNFVLSQTVTVTRYDEEGRTHVEPWVETTTTDQAFAHPIDGFAPTFPTLGCPGDATSSMSGSNSTAVPSSSGGPNPATGSDSSRDSSKMSSGAIAGAVVGSIAGLIAIIAIVVLLLQRRRKQQQSEHTQEAYQFADDVSKHHYEKDSQAAVAEIGDSSRTYELESPPAQTDSEPVYEMPSDRPSQGPGPNSSAQDKSQ